MIEPCIKHANLLKFVSIYVLQLIHMKLTFLQNI